MRFFKRRLGWRRKEEKEKGGGRLADIDRGEL